MVGGGIWQTTPELLKKIRKEIEYSENEIIDITTNKKFNEIFPSGIQGESKTKKNTDAYASSDPPIELLEMKGFCTKENINDKVLTSRDCIKQIIFYFKMTKPLIDYLNKIIEYEE